LRNNATKYKYNYGSPVTPQLSPSTTYGFGTQIAGLQQQYAGALALKKMQVAQANAAALQARQAAGAQERTDMAGAVNSALDRGLVGSSIDTSQRASVLAALAANKASIAGDRAAAIGQAQTGALQAAGQYYLGLGQAQAQQAFQQEELAIQQYQNDQLTGVLQKLQALQSGGAAKPGTRKALIQQAAASQWAIYNKNPGMFDPRVGPHMLGLPYSGR
jgi:hypothetical protein